MNVVGHDEWIGARKELLAKEKEFTRARDEVTKRRQALPWEAVEKEYVFDGPGGKETLAELFDGRSQLIAYHFMIDPVPSITIAAPAMNAALSFWPGLNLPSCT